MVHKRHVGILTIVSFAVSPIYAATLNLSSSPYLPRETFNVQGGHGWQNDVDGLLPLFGDYKHLLYTNGALSTSNTSSGGEIGLGYRQLTSESHLIYGGYAYLGRYKADYNNYFSQGTLGLEILSKEWDARINAYLPVGTKRQTADGSGTLSDLHFQAHKLIGNETVVEDTVESGADVEIGHLVPGFTEGSASLRAYLAYYRKGFNHDAKPANGGRIRAEYRINDYVTLTASESYDKQQGNQFVLGVRASIGNYPLTNPSNLEYRMNEYIMRRQGIYTDRSSSTGPFVSPENFYFVNNSPTFVEGNGTYEEPYDTVQSAESAAANDGNPNLDYIYIYRGDGTPYNIGSLILGRNRVFIGSGSDLIYRGITILPASSSNPSLMGGLTVNSNSMLAGFDLDGTATGLSTGISGDRVENLSIENVNISNYTGGNGADGTNGQDGQNGDDPTNGTDGGNGEAGASAYGIHLTNSSNILIQNINISNITGGNGGRGGLGGIGGNGNNVSNGGANGGNGGLGGNGGNAIGLGIENSQQISLQNLNITNLTGGNANFGGDGESSGTTSDNPGDPSNPGGNGGNGANGGNGGNAFGVQFSGVSSASINTVNANALVGGNADEGGWGGDGGDAGGTEPPPSNGGNGGNAGNGGNGGNAAGVQLNGAANTTVTNINTGTATGGLGAAGGNHGVHGDPTTNGTPGTDGTDGTQGADGTTGNVIP